MLTATDMPRLLKLPVGNCDSSLIHNRDSPSRSPSRDVTMAPMLWRVRAYSGPGFPNPATSQGSGDDLPGKA